MADNCRYEAEIRESSSLIADLVDPENKLPKEIVWQSRSGPPSVPWLEPDINDKIKELASEGTEAVAVSPVGFPVENFEILWDLDHEASDEANNCGMSLQAILSITILDLSMIGDLLCERIKPIHAKAGLGRLALN